MEIVTAVVLFGIIFLSIHMEGIQADSGVTTVQKEAQKDTWKHGRAREGDIKTKREKQEEGCGSRGQDDRVQKSTKQPLETEHEIEGFKIIRQDPELPTGCEITSLTMVLNYYGMSVDKVTMAEEFLPVVPAEFHFDKDGNLHGADLERYFVGNPATKKGYICGTEAIKSAADKYLESIHNPMRAVDKTGASLEELYQWISEDIPVVVWVTIDMEERTVIEGWYTESGGYVEWGSNDHGAVLIGYTPDKVTIADPIAGRAVYSRKSFENVFASRGNKCIILK